MLVESLLSLVHSGFELFGFLLELCHAGLCQFSLFAQPLLHESSYFGSLLLALGQQLIQLLLGLTTASVGSLHGCNGFGSALEMFLLQTSDHPFGLFVDKFEC